MEHISLGSTDISISPLGVGTWQWGDRTIWGYGRGQYTDADLEAAFRAGLQAGINFFDTAEVYGGGRSETLLGQFIRTVEVPVVVATKFFPGSGRRNRRDLLQALRGSLRRLGMEQVALYQIHWPDPAVPDEVWADALADAVEAGLTRAAGVSNYSLEQVRRTAEVLARRGLPLASVQVEYSLLERTPEQDGLLDYCRQNRVTLIAYSPLAKGMLTGKYTPQNPPPGERRREYGPRLESIQPLVARMREIGQAHGGKTPAQVALNWLIGQGAVPIPGAKNERQAQDNAGAMGWSMTEEEMRALDEASRRTNQRVVEAAIGEEAGRRAGE